MSLWRKSSLLGFLWTLIVLFLFFLGSLNLSFFFETFMQLFLECVLISRVFYLSSFAISQEVFYSNTMAFPVIFLAEARARLQLERLRTHFLELSRFIITPFIFFLVLVCVAWFIIPIFDRISSSEF